METIGKEIRRHAARIEMRRRVVVLEQTKGPIVIADASSITSPVPFVRLERGTYGNRRRRLQIVTDDGTVGLVAHVRPAPKMRDDERFACGTVREARGRAVNAWVADRVAHKIHLLVDLDTAVLGETDAEKPAEIVANAVLGSALDALLTTDAAPVVGPRVVEQLHQVLRRRTTARWPRYEREIAFLESAAMRRVLPRTLHRRLEALKAAVRGEIEHDVASSLAALEAERLVRLVESRACGWLRAGEGMIRGLVNPRELDATWGHAGLMFALRPSPIPDGPDLLIWPAGRAEPDSERVACLGPGTGVFRRLQKDNDVYGLVDCVLNFIETNHLGAVPLDAAYERPHFTDLLEMLF